MKNIRNHNLANAKMTVNPIIPSSVSDEAAVLVNDLFDDLMGAKPAWKQSFPNSRILACAKREWTKAFVESGIKNKFMIAKGKSVVRRSTTPFFPSVGEFIGWCKPAMDDFGLPDVEAAYREACNAGVGHTWSHDAVCLTARAIGFFDLRRSVERLMLPTFRKIYGGYCEKVMRGDKLMMTLPPPKPKAVFDCEALPVRPDGVGDFLKDMRKGLR